jgi:hypothetical protein
MTLAVTVAMAMVIVSRLIISLIGGSAFLFLELARRRVVCPHRVG